MFGLQARLDAIIRHAQSDGNIQQLVHPVDSVVGKWGGNASCVAIGPDLVITTRHQNGGVGTSVQIAGGLYMVEACYDHPDIDGLIVDIRIARLKGAAMTSYVRVVEPWVTLEKGTQLCIGGYGKVRGQECYSQGNIYAYSWMSQVSPVLNWCTNVIESVSGGSEPNFLSADFDGPDPAIDGPATPFEGIVAEFDSGGGWFVNVGGIWYLAGLSYAVEHNNEARFRLMDPNLKKADADMFFAHNLKQYSSWIMSYVWHYSSDFDLNGEVDMLDFSILSANWLKVSTRANLCQDEVIDINDLQVFIDAWSEE